MSLVRFEMKWPDALLERVDQWRYRQPIQPTRTEALRELVNKGLEAEEITDRLESNGVG